MREQKLEAPVAEAEREGLVERQRAAAPGQKLILVATASVAALLILFGIASRNNYFGLLGAPAQVKSEGTADSRLLSAPEVKVPLSLGAPSAPSYVECPGGLRLPVGLDCPQPEKKAEQAPAAPDGPSEEDRVRERRRKSGIQLGQSSGPAVALAQRTALAGGESVAAAQTPHSGPNALSSALLATVTAGTTASVHRQPSMTLAKGTLPDCTLLTAILTDQPGFLKCILSAPVMSMDGKVVLMEAGTTMEGEYTQGMQAGQSTIFTLWSRAVTPHFVTVQLNSPGTDPLGRAGTSGQVDNKWFERYAGAVFFSLFEDAKQVVIARDDARASDRGRGNASGNSYGDTFNIGAQGRLSQLDNTGSTTKSIVEEMLRQGSQVKPSLYKNQGEVIKIYVARDVDFSTVYALRPVASLN
ncbi:MAG: TrbI/VirB10 family protein [Comamonadaceae bacterium]|nr:MAG: TrbI/VirB10 family protein [Comamonadaceae bacterium]